VLDIQARAAGACGSLVSQSSLSFNVITAGRKRRCWFSSKTV